MFSNAARFLMVSAAASLVSLGSATADACSAVADAAEALIASGDYYGSGGQFVTPAIMMAMGWTSGTDVALHFGSTSPNSSQYYNLITQATPNASFTQITNIADVARGDIWAISGTATYSGHTVIVLEPPAELVPQINPKYADTRQWVVKIADSTSSVHGCNATYPDSRWTGPCKTGTFEAGPGTAYMRIYTDLAGNFQGHTWSVTSSQSSYYPPTTATPAGRPYAIGRLSCEDQEPDPES